MARGFRDRDFVESFEGLVLCVIGNVHPKGRVVSYLKYVRGMESSVRVKWSRDGVQYGRILPFYSATGVKSVLEWLRERHPEYVVFDRYRGVELIEAPVSSIAKHYRPEERLGEIVREPRDFLERLALEIASRISEESGVPLSSFGVTGSILLKIHNLQYSDIDLVVYGVGNSYRVREALKNLYSDPSSGFSLPTGEVLEEWARDIARVHPISVEEGMKLYSRYKWNRALYKGRQFSIHPVKLDEEVSEVWEQKLFQPVGIATVRARVVDAGDSLFMPAIYRVGNVRVVEGAEEAGRVSLVVSYEGLYIDIAREGEEVVARGKVEKVYDTKSGETYYQLTVGSFEAQGKDFIKPVEWLKGFR